MNTWRRHPCVLITFLPKKLFFLKSGLTIKHEYLRISCLFSHFKKSDLEVFLTFSRHYFLTIYMMISSCLLKTSSKTNDDDLSWINDCYRYLYRQIWSLLSLSRQMFRSQEHRVVQVGYWELQKILQTVQWRYSENRILQRTLFRIFLVERKWYIGVNIPYTLKYLRLGRESIFWQIFSWFLVNNQNCMQNPVKHLRWNFVNGGTLLTILSKSSILDVWQGFIYASGSVFSTKLASKV